MRFDIDIRTKQQEVDVTEKEHMNKIQTILHTQIFQTPVINIQADFTIN